MTPDVKALADGQVAMRPFPWSLTILVALYGAIIGGADGILAAAGAGLAVEMWFLRQPRAELARRQKEAPDAQ